MILAHQHCSQTSKIDFAFFAVRTELLFWLFYTLNRIRTNRIIYSSQKKVWFRISKNQWIKWNLALTCINFYFFETSSTWYCHWYIKIETYKTPTHHQISIILWRWSYFSSNLIIELRARMMLILQMWIGAFLEKLRPAYHREKWWSPSTIKAIMELFCWGGVMSVWPSFLIWSGHQWFKDATLKFCYEILPSIFLSKNKVLLCAKINQNLQPTILSNKILSRVGKANKLQQITPYISTYDLLKGWVTMYLHMIQYRYKPFHSTPNEWTYAHNTCIAK